MARRLKRVALIYDAKLPYDLKVMTGVAAYLHEGAQFNVYIEETALKFQRLPDLRSWDGDGIIADFDDPGVARAVVRSGLPVVGFGGGYGWFDRRSSIPYFFSNQVAVAHLAADHLLERGFRHFAYCGNPPTPTNGWSQEREEAFSQRVKSRGFTCHTYQGSHRTSRLWASLQRSIGSWLESLPKPLGVMVANDKRAHQLLEACRAHALRVPEAIAVVGVDNDELLCQLCTPTLSSVEQDAHRIGYESAALLNRMMHGKQPRRRNFVIDPVRVVTRRSSDVLAVQDPAVAKALGFIQAHALEGIKVSAVVNEVAISRSGLEARFTAAVGYTVHSAIRKTQLERARRLISETNLPIKQVAANTGFKSVQHMTTLFGKAFGEPPAKYREQLVP